MLPPRGGVTILVPTTRRASAATHGREVLGAILLAALRALWGESTSQLLQWPWVARERLGSVCGNSPVNGKSQWDWMQCLS